MNSATTAVIDTSPDFRTQCVAAGVTRLDAVLLTHEHADQTHGIDDVRAFFLRQGHRIPCWMDGATAAAMQEKFSYIFNDKAGYPAVCNLAKLPPLGQAFGIVGHLIFADRTDWMPRLLRILEHGDQVAFDPFDRLGQVQASRGKTLDQLLSEFAQVRAECLTGLHKLNLQPQDLEKRGRHPALGPVKASELLATWAVHDLNHLHQLSRVMAHQYRNCTGPFQAYLGVLHCNGHGA